MWRSSTSNDGFIIGGLVVDEKTKQTWSLVQRLFPEGLIQIRGLNSCTTLNMKACPYVMKIWQFGRCSFTTHNQLDTKYTRWINKSVAQAHYRFYRFAALQVYVFGNFLFIQPCPCVFNQTLSIAPEFRHKQEEDICRVVIKFLLLPHSVPLVKQSGFYEIVLCTRLTAVMWSVNTSVCSSSFSLDNLDKWDMVF